MNGWVALAGAIINTAMIDYVRAKRKLATDPMNVRAYRQREECKQFFESAYFSVLSLDMDATWLLRELDRIADSGETLSNWGVKPIQQKRRESRKGKKHED